MGKKEAILNSEPGKSVQTFPLKAAFDLVLSFPFLLLLCSFVFPFFNFIL